MLQSLNISYRIISLSVWVITVIFIKHNSWQLEMCLYVNLHFNFNNIISNINIKIWIFVSELYGIWLVGNVPDKAKWDLTIKKKKTFFIQYQDHNSNGTRQGKWQDLWVSVALSFHITRLLEFTMWQGKLKNKIRWKEKNNFQKTKCSKWKLLVKQHNTKIN